MDIPYLLASESMVKLSEYLIYRFSPPSPTMLPFSQNTTINRMSLYNQHKALFLSTTHILID